MAALLRRGAVSFVALSRSVVIEPARGLIRSMITGLDVRTGEPVLARGLTRLVLAHDAAAASGAGRSIYALAFSLGAHHPVRATLAVLALARLPRLTAHLDGTSGGLAIRRELALRYRLGPSRGAGGVAVLPIPAERGAYTSGASRQTLRRKMRAAERSGVTCRLVRDGEERLRLLALAEDAERRHVDPRYRSTSPDGRDALAHDLWLVAEVEETPLLLAVVPTSGSWGLLRLFRTIGSGPVHSDARYYAMVHLVDELTVRGVRQLVDAAAPFKLSNGLRHFQRMLGFRYARVAVRNVSQQMRQSGVALSTAGKE